MWATFSADQVDFDFTNPDVLVEFASILGFYLDQGATRIRLDAIAYIWKRIGTSCVHLPEAHEVVKLLRTLVVARDPNALVITETNVPHDRNMSYFGDGDEAHVVYNFTLAPLIVLAMLAESAEALSRWIGELVAPPAGCTFLNFIASHDGIGLRPIEDLVGSDELGVLLQAATDVGGGWNEYETPSGPQPYELNVSLADLLAGVDGATAHRFVAAHAIVLAVAGIPAIYVHSLLMTPGDHHAVAKSGKWRDINRAVVDAADAAARVAHGWRGRALAELRRLIRVRRAESAFAPDSPQAAHDIHPSLFVLERGQGLERILAVTNVSSANVTVAFDAPWLGEQPRDLVSGRPVSVAPLAIRPWQTCWLRADAPSVGSEADAK